MFPSLVDSSLVVAFEWAAWFSVGFSWLVSAIALLGAACIATAVMIFVGTKISDSAQEALLRVEKVVQEQRGIGVPAIATLVAGVGAALSGVFLSKWGGCAVAVLAALATFTFESLAQNSKAKVRLARWIFALGAVLPLGAIVVASLLTGGFGDVDLEETVLGIVAVVVGVLGVVSGFVAFWETKSEAELG